MRGSKFDPADQTLIVLGKGGSTAVGTGSVADDTAVVLRSEIVAARDDVSPMFEHLK